MVKATISEAITTAKQKENEIFRLTQLKKSIINQEFDESKFLGKKEEFSANEYNEKKAKFILQKKAKIEQLDFKVDALVEEIIKIRNKINKKNIEEGLDKKLIQMKWLRIRLDNSMKALGQGKRRGYWDGDNYLNQELFEELGFGDKLKKLEDEKNKLDAEIQKLNNTLTVDL